MFEGVEGFSPSTGAGSLTRRLGEVCSAFVGRSVLVDIMLKFGVAEEKKSLKG
jgi:hypothetical protein